MKRRNLYRLFAVLLGFAVAFGAIEITLRLTLPPVDLDLNSGRLAGSHPMADWAKVDAFCAYRAIPGEYLSRGGKTVNSDGFISTPEIERAKPAGTLRLAFLGGSSTAGSVPILPDGKTFPWIAAERLGALLPGREVDFLDGALPGYTTFESYGRLWSRIRFYEPDAVIVYHGWNDMYYFARPEKTHRWRVGPGGDWSFARPMIRQRIEPHWTDRWIGWSQLLCRIRRRFFSTPLRGEVGPSDGGKPATTYDPRGPEIFRANLKLMLAAQEPLGFKLYVAKQATLIVPGLPESERARCSVQFHGFDFEAHLRAFAEIYRIVDEEVPASQVIDLTPLSGRRTYLYDHVHLTEAGAREVGERIAQHLAVDYADAAAR